MTIDTEQSGKEPGRYNPHDAAFKSAFQKKEPAVRFFRTYLPAQIVRHIDFGSTDIFGKSFVDENMKELHSDIVCKARAKGRDAFPYLLSEHRSTPDYRMIFRLLCYIVNLWKKYREQYPKKRHQPVIIPLVFYHGKGQRKAPPRFTELFTDAEPFRMFIPDFAYGQYIPEPTTKC